MINMRYFIVSLAAVFLALGIGIFIGFTVDGQEIFLNQQETLIDEMEYKFGEIRKENEELQENIELKSQEIKNYEDFTSMIFPTLANSKLQGLNIAIIETNDDYIYNEIPSAVEKAGGKVPFTIYIKKEFLLEDSKKFNEIYHYFTKEKGGSIDKDNFQTFLAEKISQAILEQNLQMLEFFRKQDMIEVKGEYTSDIDYFIIAGGSATKERADMVKKVDIPFINKIKEYNLPVIGVEQSDVKYSYIEQYKKQKISTIDNIDTLIGQYSLIKVMQGNEGNYGIKSSADFLIPQP
ncbi:copper transporter [Garciella nitratireducens]|uniref:Copper transport outer membrane protein, MctB n=1 Tax=Garciella nitratireducens DSM 15102 TaxID=1121911 RepID=A0A1T4JU00_9FIRM|nr:copper transporter [Garciella nitratireducens]RBP45568.1 copper transport outer membrane protein MctB [Garciella nitratireducens]SJZ33613.1 Copper transport outer membrane protein, MctB [Garciella nitratireducens DSM 15102]